MTHHLYICFFFNDTATTEIYTLSLHDALPISYSSGASTAPSPSGVSRPAGRSAAHGSWENRRWLCVISRPDRKSTRLNSSHANISYAVFCLKKKKKKRSAYLL